MAYITKEEVAAIRKELKSAFPSFKFSVRNSHYMKVNVVIKKSDVDFSNLLDEEGRCDGIYMHQIERDMTKEQKTIFEKIFHIIKTAPEKVGGSKWYNNSDVMTDYYDVAYYYSLSIEAQQEATMSSTKNIGVACC